MSAHSMIGCTVLKYHSQYWIETQIFIYRIITSEGGGGYLLPWEKTNLHFTSLWNLLKNRNTFFWGLFNHDNFEDYCSYLMDKDTEAWRRPSVLLMSHRRDKQDLNWGTFVPELWAPRLYANSLSLYFPIFQMSIYFAGSHWEINGIIYMKYLAYHRNSVRVFLVFKVIFSFF